MIDTVSAYIFGYDVFISYSWKDGREYAARLRDALSVRYRVFLDDAELHSGLMLRTNLGVALRRSGALAVVVTKASLESPHVHDELRAFARCGRPLIPINVGDRLRRDPTSQRVSAEFGPSDVVDILGSRIWVNDLQDRLATGPSAQAIDRLSHAFVSIRRGRIRTLAALAAVALFATISVVALYQRDVAREQRDRVAAEALARTAMAQADTEPDLAMLLAVQAVELDARSEFPRSALLGVVAGHGRAAGYGSNGTGAVGGLHPLGGDSLFAVDEEGRGRRWVVDRAGTLATTGREIDLAASVRRPENVGVRAVTKGLDGSPHVVVTVTTYSRPTDPEARRLATAVAPPELWDLDTGRIERSQPFRSLDGRSIAAHELSSRFFGIDANGHVRAATVHDAEPAEIRAPGDPTLSAPLAVAARTPLIAAMVKRAGPPAILIWNYETGTVEREIELAQGEAPDAIRLSAQGDYLSVETEARLVGLFKTRDGARVELTPPFQGADPSKAYFDPLGRRVAVVVSRQSRYESGRQQVEHEIWLYDLGERSWWSPRRFTAPSGSSAWINAVAFGPGGRLMVSGDRGGRLIAWQLTPEHVLGDRMDPLTPGAPTQPQDSSVTSLRFSGDGRLLAGGTQDGSLSLWDTATHRRLAGGTEAGSVAGVAFAGSRLLVATMSDPASDRARTISLRRWDPLQPSDRPIPVQPFPPIVLPSSDPARGLPEISLTADGRGALVETGGEIRVWNPDRVVRRLPVPPTASTWHVTAFSADGSTVATRAMDGPILVGNLATGDKTVVDAKPSLRGVLEAIALSHDGAMLAFSEHGEIRVWDLRRGAESQRGTPMRIANSDGFDLIVFDRSGRYIASAAKDGTLRLWSVSTGASIGVPIDPGSDGITRIAVDGSGNRLASGHASGAVYLWDLDPTHLVHRACRMAGRTLTETERRRFLTDIDGVGGCRPASDEVGRAAERVPATTERWDDRRR